MVMDRSLSRLYGSINGIKFSEDSVSILSDQNLSNGPGSEVPIGCVDIPPFPPDPGSSNKAMWSSVRREEDPHEDCDFSDVVLKYINEMLMEEKIEEKTCMFQESSALQTTEKSFYDVIGEKYPPPIDHRLMKSSPYVEENQENSSENSSGKCSSYSSITSSTSDGNLVEHVWNGDLGECKSAHSASQSTSQSSFNSSNGASNIANGYVDSPMSTLRIPDIFSDNEAASLFRKGVEEASKFLPNSTGLFVDLVTENSRGLVKQDPKDVVVKMEKKHGNEYFTGVSRGKKNPYPEDLDSEEERNSKQSAVYNEMTVTSEMFDLVLLCNEGKGEAALRESFQNEANKTVQQDGQSKGSNTGKSRGRKKGGSKDLVDLTTLLTLCAQAVAADDWRTANEQLKQIRQHASPTGDGRQRMAHYFANGLEARMAGSGTRIYKAVITKPTSAAIVLKAYHLLLAVCPFKKLPNFFSNKTITKVAERAARLHIVDFGILYGFQWPSLIQRLSSRPGGPPKLRITGIDLPQPGFRPAERVEETGHRLANYARSFNVPFEFNAIAQKWETIQVEDLKIDSDELLVVNCNCRFRNLLDETVVVESPRNIVLNLIRKMNPDIFIQGIVNGGYGAPFFLSRFREALFHFSALFDILEATVPRQTLERTLIEREIFGWDAMNVIACEGSERIERPETYRQWQIRNLRAGFRQLPLDQEIFNIAKEKVKLWYHKDFAVDQDGQWLLQGWKGRIIFAISSWKAVQ